jgi:hypothetical protein
LGKQNIPFPFLGGANRTRSAAADAQTTVNLYPEIDPEARGKGVLYGIPGLTQFADTGTAVCRGSHVMAGVAYFVNGTVLYQVLSNGTAGALGFIGGTGPVSMADNGTKMLIVNGSQGYVYSTGTGLSTITSAGFPASYTCAYLAGYFIVAAVGTGEMAPSEPDDPFTWNPLNRFTAESQPDGIQAIARFNGELHALGDVTREVFYINNNPTGAPLSPNNGAQIDRGCIAKYSAATDMTAVYWLGDDLVVYAASQYTPAPISNNAVNYDISITANPENAIGFTFQDQGHYFYALTFPTGKTWVYDITTQLWHRRQSFGIDRWRAVWPCKAYGKWLFGDCQSDLIGEQDYDAFTEYGDFLRWERTCAPLTQGNNGIFLDRFEVVMESGTGDPDVNPVVNLEYSTDGGRTFCDPIEANYGAAGEYRWRTFWCGLGYGENFTMRIWSADAYRRNIVDASISFEVGAP